MITCPYDAGYYDQSLGMLICRPTGEVTEDLALDLATCRECIEKAGAKQIKRFHDMRDVTSLNLRFSDILITCQTESAARSPQQLVKACYLVPNALLYGTVRMYQALAESRGVEVHVTYDIKDAAEFLGVQAADLES